MSAHPFSITLAARRYGDAIALITDERTWSFRELALACDAMRDRVRALAASPTQPVALRASNRVQTVLTLLCLIEEQSPFVLVHPRLTAHEADLLVRDSHASVLLDDSALDELTKLCKNSAQWTLAPVDPERPLAILYTSGTSGSPKGATLSHRAFAASARASAERLRWAPQDRWLLCLPLCHIGGLSVLTRCIQAGATVRLLARFDPQRVLECIAEDHCTLASVVPTMLHTLLSIDTANSLANLRVLLSGGAHTSDTLRAQCAQRGLALRATYGLTEVCSQVCTQPARDWSTVALGCGPVLSHVRAEIVDAAQRVCAPDEIGLLRVQGEGVMSGYLHHAPLSASDWLDTGDFASLSEDGVLTLHARRSDLIVTGGENVYPVEVEQALCASGAVHDALVVGVTDAQWGQRVGAMVVLREGTARGEPLREAIERTLSARLARYKWPTRWVFASELPLLSSGKSDRAEAARRVAREGVDVQSVD
ncbi:MAG: class I adenylate-forming enzyme family protein [Deltaproteobacteria bacterium]|nr:class I adenylate-forming enzyme family protein [Deltaproteobacteria bacterium]